MVTQAAAWLLDVPELRAPILELIEGLQPIGLDQVETFHAEVIATDGRRPDLEGLDIDRRPRVIIELKFLARITPDQLAAYRRDQMERLDGVAGITAIVVPVARVTEAEDAIDAIPAVLSGSGAGKGDGISVVPWEEWLHLWDQQIANLPRGEDGLAADVIQFIAMCRQLLAHTIQPFGVAASGQQWRQRQRDIVGLPDHIAARLNYGNRWGGYTRLSSAGKKPPFLRRRVVNAGSFLLTVGVRPDLADAGDDPLWIRVEAASVNLSVGLSNLTASKHAPRLRMDADQVWVPLELSPSCNGVELVEDLAAQVVAIGDAIEGPASDGGIRV